MKADNKAFRINYNPLDQGVNQSKEILKRFARLVVESNPSPFFQTNSSLYSTTDYNLLQ